MAKSKFKYKSIDGSDDDINHEIAQLPYGGRVIAASAVIDEDGETVSGYWHALVEYIPAPQTNTLDNE